MKQHRQTNAWILLCSVIVVTVVATEHSSQHNGLPYHGGTGHRRQHPHEPTGTDGLQMPEAVMSHPDVSCISTDKNIFEIMNKAKISCQGNDMVCTFYIYKDHRYYNLGSLEINKDKFDNLLRKYDSLLLTAGKIENRKDAGRKHDKVNDLIAVDTANVKFENGCDDPAQIDSQEVKNPPDYHSLNIDTSNMSDILDVSKENYIESTGENQSQANNKENTVRLIDVEEKQGKKGNYIKLKPKYDKDYEVFLPKDKSKGKSSTINVDIINKDNQNLFFKEGDNDIHTDTLENRRNVNSPSFTNNSEHKIPNEVSNNNIENLTPLDNLKDVIQNQICNNLKMETLATSYSNPEPNLRQDLYVEKDTKTGEVPYVFNPNICNFNANQKLMVGDDGEKVKSIVNLSHNVCVPDKYANHAEYYVESQLNNDCNRKMLTGIGDTPTNKNFDKNNKDNNLNLPPCNILGSDTNQNDTLEKVPLNNPCDEHIYNPHDFDETHDVSMHHNDSVKTTHIHINEPIFKFDHTHEHDLDHTESIADCELSLTPNDPSLPVCTASDLVAGSAQISQLDPENRLPTSASNIQYLSPILPAPPLDNIMVLNMGSEKSSCDVGYSWLPSYSRIKELRLQPCKARPISLEPATPIPQSNIQDPNIVKAVTDGLEVLSPIVESTLSRDDCTVQTDCTDPFDCKIACPVQEISQAPTSLIGPSIKDLGYINYSPFEQIPIFNEQETMIPLKTICPCVCVPNFVQPYLKTVCPNIISTPYFCPTENYLPSTPETIRNLDNDCLQNIAQLPSQSLIQESPIIPCLQNPQLCLGPCFCGIPICSLKPFTVANTPCYNPLPVPCSPYTCVSDNGLKHVPSYTNGILLQNQMLEALEAVPCLKEEYPYLDMDIIKNIISEQKPLSNSVNTSPVPTNLVNSFPSLAYSNHLPKFLNSIPVLDKDFAVAQNGNFAQIPETKIISGNSVKPELYTSQNRLPVKVLDSSLIGPNILSTLSIPNHSLNGENIQSICYGSPSESDLDDLIPLDSSLIEPELGLDIPPLTTDYRPPQSYYNRPKLPGNILPSSLIPPSLFDQPSTIPNLKTNNSKQLKLKLNKLPLESNLQTDDFIQISEEEANRYLDEYSSLLVQQNHQLPSEFTGSTGTLITTDVFNTLAARLQNSDRTPVTGDRAGSQRVNQPSIVSPILNKPRDFPESVKPISGLTILPSENIQFLSPSQLDKGISKTSPVSYSEISQYRPSLSSLDYSKPQSYIKYVTPQNFISEIPAESIEAENRTPMLPLSASDLIMTPLKLTPKNPTFSSYLTGPSLSELPSSSKLLPSVPCTLSSFDNLTPMAELPEAQEILLWSEIKDIPGGHLPSNEICSPQIPLTPLSKLLPICSRPGLGKYDTLHTPQYSYLPSSYVNPTFMPQQPMSVPIQESYISPSELAALLPSSLYTSPTLNLHVQSPRPQLTSYVDTSEVSVPTSQYSILPQKTLSHTIPLESLPISTYTNPIEAESNLSEPYHKLLSTLGPELKEILEQSISLSSMSQTPCQGLPSSSLDTPKFISPSFRKTTNILQENLPICSYPAVCPYAPNIPSPVHNSPISPLSFKSKPQFYTPSELLYPCDELLSPIDEAQPVEIKPLLNGVSLKPCNVISPQLNIPICPPKSISPYIEPSSYVPLHSPDLISEIPLSDFTSLKPVSSSRPGSFTSETLPVPICDTTPLNILDKYYEVPTATPTAIKGQPCIDLSSALTPETILESPTHAQIRPLDADYQILPNILLPFTSLSTAPVSYQSPVSGIFTPHPINTYPFVELPKNLPFNLPMPIASESPFVLIRPTINHNWQINPLSKPPSISPISPVCITPDKNITPYAKDLPLNLDSFICNDDQICLDNFRPLLDENTLELLKDMSFWHVTPTSIAPAIPSADYTVPGKLQYKEYLSQPAIPSAPFVPYNQLLGENILSPYITCKESNVSPTKHRPITPFNPQPYLPSTLPISNSPFTNIPEYHIADSALLGESILPIEGTTLLSNPKFSTVCLPCIDNPLQVTDINSFLDTESFQNILSPTTCDSLKKLVPNISPETITSDLHAILDADVMEMRPLLPSPRPIIPSSLYPNTQPYYPIIHPQIHHPIMYPQRIPYQQRRPLNLQPCILPAEKLLDQELLQIIETLPDIVHSPYIPKKKNQLSSSLLHMSPSTISDAFETKGPCPVLPYSESNDNIVLEPVTQLSEDDITSLISSDISNVELTKLTNLLPQYKLPSSPYIQLPFSPETSSIPSLSPLESRPVYSRLFPITETIKSIDFQPSEIQNILKLLESTPSSEIDAESLQENTPLLPVSSSPLPSELTGPSLSAFTTPLAMHSYPPVPSSIPYKLSEARQLSQANTKLVSPVSYSPLPSELTGPSLSSFITPLTMHPYEQIPSVPYDLSEATLLSLADTGFPSPFSSELTGPSLPGFTTPLTTLPYEQARPLSQANTTPLVPVSSRPLSSELTGPSLSAFTTPLTVHTYEPTPSYIPYELSEARPLSLTDTTSLLPGSPRPLPSDLTGPSLLASTTPLMEHPYAPTSIYTKPSSIPYKLSDALQSEVLPVNYIPLSLDDCCLLSPEYLNQKTLTSNSSSTLTSPIFAGKIGPTPQIIYDSESPLISTVPKPLAPGYTKYYPQIYNGHLLPLSVNPFSPRYGHFPLSPPSLLEDLSPYSPALQILNENQLIPVNYHPPRRPLTSLVQNPCEIVSPQIQLEPSNILQYSDVTNPCINAGQWLPITLTTSSQRYPTYKPQLLVSKPIDSSTPIDINNLINIIPEKEIWSNAQPAYKSLKLEKPTYSNQDNVCEDNNVIYQDIRETELQPLLESLTKILEADKTGSVVDRDFSQYVEVMPSLPVPTLGSVPIRESKLYQRPCLSPYSPICDSPIFTSSHSLPITLAPSIQASPYVLPMIPSSDTLKSVPALVPSSPFIKPLLPASPEFINICYQSASIIPPYTHLSPLTDIEKTLSESQLPYKILPELKKLQLYPAMSIQNTLSPEEIQTLIAAQTPRIPSSPYLSYKPIDTVSIPTDFSRFPAISPSVAIPLQSLTMPILNSVSSPIRSIKPQLTIPNICDSYIPRSPTYTKKLNTHLYQGLPIGPSPVLIHDVPATYAKPLQNIALPETSTMFPQYLPLSSPALTLQESNYYPCSVMNEVPLYPQLYINPSTKIPTPINIKSNVLKNPPKLSNPCLQSYTEVPSSANIGSPCDLIEADTTVINRPQKFLTPTEQYSLPTKLKLSPLTILPNAVPITGIPLETIDRPKYIPCSAKQPLTYNSLSYPSPITLDSEYLTLPTSKGSPLLNIPRYSVTPLSYPVNEETLPCYPCNVPLKQPIKANSYNQYKVPLQPLELPTSYLPESSPCIQYPVQSLQKLSPVPCQYIVPSSSPSSTPLLAPNISPNYQIAEPYLPQPCRSNIPAYSSPIQKYSSLVNPFINADFESVPVKPLSPILNKSVPLLKVTSFDTIVPTPYTYPLDISQAITPEYITTTVPVSPLHSSSLVKSLTNSVFSPKLSTESLAPISPLSPISYHDSHLTPCLLSPSSPVLKSPLLRPLLINSQNAVPLPSPYTNLNKELPKIGPTPIIGKYNEYAPLTSTKLAKDLPFKPCITPYISPKSTLTEQLLSPIPCLPLSPISKSLLKLVEPQYETVLPEPILTQSNPYTTKPPWWNSPLTPVIPLYDDLKPPLVNSEPYAVPYKQLPSYAPYHIPQTFPSALLKTNIVKDTNPIEYLQSKSSPLPHGLPPEIETILTNYDQYISNKKYPKLPLAAKQQSQPRHSTQSPLIPYSDLITNNFSPYETLTPIKEISSYRLPIASKGPSISPIEAKFVDATDYISKAPTTSKPSPEFAEYLPSEISPIDTIAPILTDTPSNILPLKYSPSEMIPERVSSYLDISKYKPANIIKPFTEIPSLINNLSKVIKPYTPEELLEVEPLNFVTPKTPKLSIPQYAEYIDTEKVNKYDSKITSAETENVRLGAKPVIVDAQSVTEGFLNPSKVNKASVNIENYINGEFEVPQYVPISLAPNRLGRPDLAKGPDNVAKYAPYVPIFSPTGNNIRKHSKPIPHYSRPISHKPKNTLKYGDFYANNHIGKSPEVVNIPAKINYDTLPANSNTNTIIPYNTVSPEIYDDFITIPLKSDDLVPQLEVANLKLDEGYTETPYNPIEDAVPCINSQDILKPCPELNPVTYSPLLDIPNEISNAKLLSPTLQAIRSYPMKFLQHPCEVTEMLEPPTSYTPYDQPKTIKYSGYKTYLGPASKIPNKYQIPCLPLTYSPFKIPCSNTETSYSTVTPEIPKVISSPESPYNPVKIPYKDIKSPCSILTPEICEFTPIPTENIYSIPKLKATALESNVKYDEIPCEPYENTITNILMPCIKPKPETILSPYPEQYLQTPKEITGALSHLSSNSPLGYLKIPQVDTTKPCNIVTAEICNDFTTTTTKNVDTVPVFDTASEPNAGYTEIPCKPIENLPITSNLQDSVSPCIKKNPVPCSPYPMQFLQYPCEVTRTPYNPTSYNPYDNTVNNNYVGYKTYINPASNPPCIPPTQIYSPCIIPQSLSPILQFAKPILSTPIQYQSPIQNDLITTPCQTEFRRNDEQQSPKFNAYSPIEDVEMCKSYKEIENELKSSLVKYINSKEAMKSDLYNNCNELTIPLGDLAIANKEPRNDNTIETDNPSISLKVWKSQVKILKAELKLKFKQFSVNNFMPVVNNLDEYDVEEIRKIIKSYIDEKYGSHIEVNEPYSVDNQFTVLNDFNFDAVNNQFNILWPPNYV